MSPTPEDATAALQLAVVRAAATSIRLNSRRAADSAAQANAAQQFEALVLALADRRGTEFALERTNALVGGDLLDQARQRARRAWKNHCVSGKSGTVIAEVMRNNGHLKAYANLGGWHIDEAQYLLRGEHVQSCTRTDHVKL